VGLKLLIDENLSPILVQKLAEIGVFAQHVAHLGLAGSTDTRIWQYAYENDFVLVTLNAGDILDLASNVELHPGAIVLRRAGLDREEQWAHLQPVLAKLDASAPSASLINKVIDVFEDGEILIREIPDP